MPQLQFWFDYASTYSYLSAMRIEHLAAVKNVDVRWRPFLLGPIFKAQGWNSSPFNIYPAKGRYMVRDMERLAEGRGLGFRLPNPFPQMSLKAARTAWALPSEEWIGPFSRLVFTAQFSEGRGIDDAAVLADILVRLGLDPAPIIAASETAETKARLRFETDEAMRLGIFGAPTFITPDSEIFWGDDRLEAALGWMADPPTSA
jgi:2-hydroxychromene-2-carboxylate isomerase